MNGRMIGVIGGTGRVGRECLRYLHENTAFGLLIGGRKPPREALPGSFLSVDVFDEASLARFCGQCSLVINCAGPASAVRERVAAAALAGGCHYVDPGGYTPLFPILSSRRPEIRAKRLTFLLTLGILPGLSELFPVYVARVRGAGSLDVPVRVGHRVGRRQHRQRRSARLLRTGRAQAGRAARFGQAHGSSRARGEAYGLPADAR